MESKTMKPAKTSAARKPRQPAKTSIDQPGETSIDQPAISVSNLQIAILDELGLAGFDRQTLAGAEVIDIPFPIIRLLLPPDGKPPKHPNDRPIHAQNTIAFSIGKADKWPKGKDRFHRDELVEIAFGYILRAKNKDREDRRNAERPWGPGIYLHGGRIHFRGGWRVHKDVRGAGPFGIDDFYDGTFRGQIVLSVNNGLLTVRADNVNVDWNGGVLEALSPVLERIVRLELMQGINERIRTQVLEPVMSAIVQNENIRSLAARISAEVLDTAVRITVLVGDV